RPHIYAVADFIHAILHAQVDHRAGTIDPEAAKHRLAAPYPLPDVLRQKRLARLRLAGQQVEAPVPQQALNPPRGRRAPPAAAPLRPCRVESPPSAASPARPPALPPPATPGGAPARPSAGASHLPAKTTLPAQSIARSPSPPTVLSLHSTWRRYAVLPL